MQCWLLSFIATERHIPNGMRCSAELCVTLRESAGNNSRPQAIINYQLSIVNLLSPYGIIHYPLSIIHYQLSIINYQLSIINYQLSIVNYLLVH
ncbi:MAG: hypothetical protein LBQ64_00375 [Bacteroidales bacterium]|nr:hypothetical protein [Bacteroidales bacterium]